MLIDPRYKDACYMEKSEKQWASELLTTAAEEIEEYHQPPDGTSGSGARLPETPEHSVWHAFQSFRSETDRVRLFCCGCRSQLFESPTSSPIFRPSGLVERRRKPAVPRTGWSCPQVPVNSCDPDHKRTSFLCSWNNCQLQEGAHAH
ncbi:hypothetical protein HPB48_012732 [Haemaphysalis longicornis]|uniref:Uncharacterized protein n=1 Tax=Haemaphysalis longicornis TaxID=44386 RepID=A0A9J6FPS9_HAELO|nr:hypothetical protein HPB48_012732 [Haemaphysalis longicornis]